MKVKNGSKRGIPKAYLLFLLLGCAAMLVSCASTSPDVKEARWQENELYKGVRAYAHGYTQYHQALLNAEMDEPEKARRHLDRARKDFLKAIGHFQRAEGTREEAEQNRRIAKELSKGNEELDKADAAFEKGDQGKAGIHCGRAMNHFLAAMELMDAPQ